jgi:hypothetical protein
MMHDVAHKVPHPHWKEERWSFVKAPAVNSCRGFVGALKRHPWWVSLLTPVVLFMIFAERPYYQPIFIYIRIYGPGIVCTLGLVYGLWRILSRYSARSQALGGVIVFATAVALVVWGPLGHDYLAHYIRYNEASHKIVDLPKDKLYRTAHDRVLPLGAVHGLVSDRMNENESPAPPDLVRTARGYGWTIGVEPANLWGRFTHDVTEFIYLDATETSPDLSRRGRVNVNFDIGEDLLFSRNIDSCVRRSFGPLRIFNYQPGNILRTQDDAGRWVYVVSLIRWSWGWLGFFPWPEFGGVQIIEQNGPHSVLRTWTVEWPKHLVFGCGHWVPPEEIGKHAFLRGQNIVPYDASRFVAESNRFQAGFLGPTHVSRQGDIRIADVVEDLNLQPYVIFARAKEGDPGKLYQWFGLQPYDTSKCGLSISFLVPADGIGPSYRYNHAAHKESPIGPSCVADRVRAKQSDTYWANRRPAEAIPYVHDIADADGNIAPRLTFKTVIVTQKVKKEGDPPQFIPGTPPEIWIVDAYREHPVPVGGDHSKWDEKLREELGSKWAGRP